MLYVNVNVLQHMNFSFNESSDYKKNQMQSLGNAEIGV